MDASELSQPNPQPSIASGSGAALEVLQQRLNLMWEACVPGKMRELGIQKTQQQEADLLVQLGSTTMQAAGTCKGRHTALQQWTVGRNFSFLCKVLGCIGVNATIVS